jgi:hypothetical protein
MLTRKGGVTPIRRKDMLSQLKLLGIYQRELSKNHGCAGAALEAVAEAAVKDAMGGEAVGKADSSAPGGMYWFLRPQLEDGTPLYERPQASAAVPEGCVIVPEISTSQMDLAAVQVAEDAGLHLDRETAEAIWIAMLAASQPEVSE